MQQPLQEETVTWSYSVPIRLDISRKRVRTARMLRAVCYLQLISYLSVMMIVVCCIEQFKSDGQIVGLLRTCVVNAVESSAGDDSSLCMKFFAATEGVYVRRFVL